MFSDPSNVAVLTTRSIVEGWAWVARVSHDADDGGWQFHASSSSSSSDVQRVEAARVVSLRSMVERDGTLALLADLPLGWVAWRGRKDAPWQLEAI